MRKILEILARIGLWADGKVKAMDRRYRLSVALPVGTVVKISNCRCGSFHGDGDWKVESFNPEQDDYRLIHKTGATTIATRDSVEIV